jgi:hypothetical protein
MENTPIANLKLNVDPEALRAIIASGRLLEFADTVAKQAAAQISSQLVQHVAEAGLQPNGLKSGVSADVSYLFVVGDGEPGFGTRPRPPHWVVSTLGEAAQAGLREMAAVGSNTEG